MENKKPHVGVVVSPGMGHVIPLLELAKRLTTIDDIDVTLFITMAEATTAQSQLLQSQKLTKGLQIVELPPPDISSLVSADAAIVTRLCVVAKESVPALRSAITGLTSRPTALIVDLFCPDAFEIAVELNIPKYLYITTSAAFLALTIFVPVLDREIEGEYVDLPEQVQIPGCKPIRPEDVVDMMLDRKDDQYSWYVRTGSMYPMAHGVLVNTWEDLEPRSLTALRHDKNLQQIMSNIPIYPVGPIIGSVSSSSTDRPQCVEWLDVQPTESVLYVSFGSGGTLSMEQLTELACGLELSQQRFLWVVRPPTSDDVSATFFTSGNGGFDPLEFLPDGFMTRTRGVGFVVPMWAPQLVVLGHPSIGGFLSHCGWNSILEAIINGTPMIAWPLYAEQRMNATMLTEEFGIAVGPEVLPTKKVVGRKEIDKMVRLIMKEKEGSIMRSRVKELKNSAMKALEKGGSSYNSLSQVVKQCK